MPDEKVQSAIANWAPRFTSQGVDYNDFVRTTKRIERWDDWCREWCVSGDIHTELANQALEKGYRISAGERSLYDEFMAEIMPWTNRVSGYRNQDSLTKKRIEWR